MPGSIHELRPDAFAYAWDNALEPALEIESGETVHLGVRDASDEQIHVDSGVEPWRRLDFSQVNPGQRPDLRPRRRARRHARGRAARVRAAAGAGRRSSPASGSSPTSFRSRGCGSRRLDAGNGVVRFSDRVTLPFRPFPGTIGVAPPEPGAHSVVPPSRSGGNLDTKHLTIGTTLYLPVGVEGALFSLGDTHAAQGDGEVCGTAIETAMDVVVRLSVRRTSRSTRRSTTCRPAPSPRTEQSSYHVCTGVGPT